MKFPKKVPSMDELLNELKKPDKLLKLYPLAEKIRSESSYLHWDQLQHREPPAGITVKEWWLAHKLNRSTKYKPLPLRDKRGQNFQYHITDIVLEMLHKIDAMTSGIISTAHFPEDLQNNKHYLLSSLIEEATRSSQLEGAAATRDQAKQMIQQGRTPANRSEQMILNNFVTMSRLKGLINEELTPELVIKIHRMISEKTLDDETACGRFRSEKEDIKVMSPDGEVYHTPPRASELKDRMQAMCDFANGKIPDAYVHPAIRSIVLHFWLGYDHPFVDGNGRTARALFYWSMLRNGYWLFEFISISNVLKAAPSKYAKSFLYTETDDNDLNYFIIHQSKVIERAINNFSEYIKRKQQQKRELTQQFRGITALNKRQQSFILRVRNDLQFACNIAGYSREHETAYNTARNDLLELVDLGLLKQVKQGKAIIFLGVDNFEERLRNFTRSADQT